MCLKVTVKVQRFSNERYEAIKNRYMREMSCTEKLPYSASFLCVSPTWSPSVWFALAYIDDALSAHVWFAEPSTREHIASVAVKERILRSNKQQDKSQRSA